MSERAYQPESPPRIEVERARWTRLHRACGEPTEDPLRVFDPCDACGQRGPLRRVWEWWTWAEIEELQRTRPDVVRAAAEARVCADGCPPKEA